jgi:WD40 repeat protein
MEGHMSVRKKLLLTAVCLGLVGSLFLTVEITCSRKYIICYGHTHFVCRVVISPDGKTLASGSSDNTAKLWNVATGREQATLKGHTNSVESVAFSPDGKTLASGSTDRAVKLWDVATGQEQATLLGHTSAFIEMAFSPDGKTLATAGTSETTVKLWDVATGQERVSLQGHTGGVYSVAFSPDGETLASGSGDGTVKLWDVVTGQERATLRAQPMYWVRSVAFSPDGKTLASGNADLKVDRSEVMLWDLATGQERKRLTLSKCVDESYLYYLTFSPDGKTLVAIETFSAIHLWDIPSGENTANFDWDDYDKRPFNTVVTPVLDKLPAFCKRPDEFVRWNSVFFSPNGKLVALGGGHFSDSRKRDYTVKLLELATIPNAVK